MEKKQISRTYQYDVLNRLVSVTNKGDLTRTYSYDPAGNRTMTTLLESGETPHHMPQSGSGAAVPPSAPIPGPSPQQIQNVASTTTCPGCGKSMVSGSKFCGNCGAPISTSPPPSPSAPVPPSPAVCVGCGNPIRPGAKFCRKCGRKLS